MKIEDGWGKITEGALKRYAEKNHKTAIDVLTLPLLLRVLLVGIVLKLKISIIMILIRMKKKILLKAWRTLKI